MKTTKPLLVLRQDRAAAYQAFKDAMVPHERQLQALNDAWMKVSQSHIDGTCSPEGPAITLLYGPTGIGKTTIWQYLKEFAEELHRARGIQGTLPFLYVQAAVTSTGTVSMKSFYGRTLDAANDSLLPHHRVGRPSHGTTPTEVALERATLRMLANRQPLVLCIDEAHHLGIHSTPQQREKNLDAIKTFANSTPVPILMMGSYELVEFGHLSGRLGRRVREVDFRRYDIELQADALEFRAALHFFAQRLPASNYDLMSSRIYFHEKTVGCVGLLKTWLERAYYRALFAGRDAVVEGDILAEEPVPQLIAQWTDEIDQGEARLRELQRRRPGESNAATPTVPKTRKRKKVGQRDQLSDPVGGARRAAAAA